MRILFSKFDVVIGFGVTEWGTGAHWEHSTEAGIRRLMTIEGVDKAIWGSASYILTIPSCPRNGH